MMIDNAAREDDILSEVRPGSGLFEVTEPDGRKFITNIRRLAGKGREKKSPGTYPIWSATWLLTAIGGAALFVSFSAQKQYIFNVRHQDPVSVAEALLPDLMLAVVTLLALGLSLARKSSRTERALILVCAAVSAFMNVADDKTRTPASVAAYILGPAVFAVSVDRVVSVIRRHRLGDDEASTWTATARAAVTCARFFALVLLYGLRTALAPSETVKGLRRMVLDVAPVPGVIVVPAIETRTDSGTGPAPETEPTRQDLDEHYLDQQDRDRYDFAEAKAAFLDKYRGHEEYGDRAAAARVAALIAPLAGLRPGTGRVLAFEDLDRREQAERDGNPVFPTKKAAFLSRYRAHPEYGVRAVASRVAAEIAPLVGLQPGTGRTYAGEELNRLEAAASRRELANGAAS